MKIISEGTIPKSEIFCCPYCKTVYEADMSEVKVFYEKDELYVESECPLCGMKNIK